MYLFHNKPYQKELGMIFQTTGIYCISLGR
jgi:hypothetical protein